MAKEDAADCRPRQTTEITAREAAMSWIARLQEAKVGAVQHRENIPWLGAVRRALPPNIETISTRAILDLIDMPATTGNARKVSAVMKTLGYVPIKSRRLAPGGFRDTTTRGWARPLRETKLPCPTGSSPAGAAGVEPRGGYDEIST